MRTVIHQFENGAWNGEILEDASVVFIFGEGEQFFNHDMFTALKAHYPQTPVVGCSTSGTVLGTHISDNNVVAVAGKLEKGSVQLVSAKVDDPLQSYDVASQLAKKLHNPDLKHVLVFSDGLGVNGSELARGFNDIYEMKIPVSGGLAGDGARFEKTGVVADEPAKSGVVAALGIYSETSVIVNVACFAGWEEFGVERVVTRSIGNVVYEIDGEPALALYKKYLGEQAKDLPASGLRFPLSVWSDRDTKPLIRTLLAIDEETQTLTFAGDVTEGWSCRLMKTNIDSLIDHAGDAAKSVKASEQTGIAIVVSCVGRRLVMGQMTEEELEVMQEELGSKVVLTGFYSYGELAPMSNQTSCELHNQTMTVTLLSE